MTAKNSTFSWPLMHNNITREDLDCVIRFLQQEDPILTQSEQVSAFEQEWSKWLGVRHSVFVNSGSSANLLTMAAVKELHGPGEIIVPSLTWVSDIASVLQCGFKPIFVDISPRTLGMDLEEVLRKITNRTRAVFITHVLGFNSLTAEFLQTLSHRKIPLIEDTSESHGARLDGQKLGTLGYASNFSFYYAHHLSTIEGGMVCTNDEELFEVTRMMRSHGLVRELRSDYRKKKFYDDYPDLHPEFIFGYPAYNLRNTEINAVVGRSQLKRLDAGISQRTRNLEIFLQNLDPDFYQTDFATEGSSNYALTVILRRPDFAQAEALASSLKKNGIEYRRGTAGGGNQLRQPYLRRLFGDDAWKHFPHTDHVHFFGFYIGNYPSLEPDRIRQLCALLNDAARLTPVSPTVQYQKRDGKWDCEF